MTNAHGDFIWYELWTSDPDAAAGFYGGVLGWQATPVEGSAIGYRLLGPGQAAVAGLMEVPRDAAAAGASPRWLGYVGVDDVDRAAAAVLREGGAQHVPPTDIPGIGRFALLADPQGILFYLMRGAGEAASTAFAPDRPGHCHWNELSTPDPAAALAFYGGLFGWAPGDAMPMGELGEYRFLVQSGRTIGAMMPRLPQGAASWRFYFGVADIDAAAAAVAGHGGAVLHGPAEVPGGLFVIQARDPQGAAFGLVGQRRPGG
ncbi:VOC family protein [Roseicella frigidaeris]|uniref:VOC family protein n=1 Tax=Roseicella frigidaeris TaxID=2230885 RepID=A0A327M254_9PROT|nr:VOC family protein [Roseicella frigidaeris]RAI57351.1 VOC family protein [Roseicella frigidaeris]